MIFLKRIQLHFHRILGYDSIEPYIKDYPDKGYYILTKTSNSSSGEIQDIKSGDKEMFLHVAELIVKWFHPGIGSVAGATYPEQLEKISDIFINSGKEIPFLNTWSWSSGWKY